MQKYLMGLRNPLKCIVRIVGEICICWGDTLRRHTNSWWRSGRGKQGYSFAVQDPLYLSPLTTCNRNVEMLVQRHSHLRFLTSWAKCLRNAPCQCTAHATASADIWLFKSESVPRIGTFSPNKHEISVRNKEPEGYQLRYYILRFAGRLSWSITFRLVFSLLNLHC